MSTKGQLDAPVHADSIRVARQSDPSLQKDAMNHNGNHLLGQAIVDNLPYKFFIKDGNLRYVSVNDHLARDLGVSVEDLIGKSDADLLPPDIAKKHHAVDLDVLSTGKLIETEELLKRNGHAVWEKTIKAPFRDENGDICGVLGLYWDVTDRKKAELALQESEGKLRAINSAARDAIILMDPEGKIASWNRAAEELFGYASEQALGQSVHVLIAPEQFHEASTDGFNSFELTGQGPVIDRTVELPARRKSGIKFPIELSLSSVKLDGGWGAVGIIRDITDRKQAEAQLRHAIATERRQAEQLAIELELATNIQQAIMRSSSYIMEDLDIMASWIPASEMSGDFYALQPLDDHRLGVWIGDVSAKGVPAGLLMVLINAYLHAEMTSSFVPGNAVSQLSLNVSDLLDVSEQFTTLFLGVLDTSSGILTYSDAGHGHALIYRHASNQIEKLAVTSPPLGIESRIIAVQKEVGVNPSDIIVIFSDGITESFSPSGELFGEPRLLELVRKHGRGSMDDLHDAIITAVKEFQEDSIPMDDQTLLVIRRMDDYRSELIANIHHETGSPLQVWTQSLTSHTGVLRPLHTWVAMIGDQLNMRGDRDRFINDCQLGISELMTNVIKHAYHGEHGRITIQAREYKDRLEFDIQDKGLAYEATPVQEDDLPVLREGHYGLLITQSVMDEVIYTRTPEGVNCWRLVKNL